MADKGIKQGKTSNDKTGSTKGFVLPEPLSNQQPDVHVLRCLALIFSSFSRVSWQNWCYFLRIIYLILPAALSPGVYSAPNRNDYQIRKINVSGE
jgi:hypothetical protein